VPSLAARSLYDHRRACQTQYPATFLAFRLRYIISLLLLS